MSDFSLDDAVGGQSNASNLQSQGQGQGQNYNPWGGQNPGQQYQGFSGPGQPTPAFPGQGPGQGPQYPGYPAGGQQYPGFPGGQQFPGYPGFPGPGQQYPGAPAPGQGPAPQYPGAPAPGQGPTAPSAPSGPRKVPCELPLPSGCTKGLMLTIVGVPTGKRFNIDYKEGRDIAFHFNPRFDERPNVVVRNSMIRGEWGQEERQCPKFPFQQGQPFRIQIFFDQDCFRVMVNNENLCQYPHRSRNFSGIGLIRIDGELTINEATLSMV